MYYLLLAIAAVLFSFQFLFNQKFEEEYGSTLGASILFSLLTAFGGFAILLVINGFRLSFSFFSLIAAAAYAIIGILYTVASVKAFETVNLSAYSFFAMLGGMLLPFLYGICFCNEGITCTKILCCVFIAAAMLLTIDTSQGTGNKLYYLAVFILNGLVGVISTIHQNGKAAVGSNDFLMLSRIITVLICLPYFAKKQGHIKIRGIKPIFYSFAFALFCSTGNLLTLISLKRLPASVQYPIITGGVMAISMIISLARKEKINIKNIIALAAALGATVLIAF